MKKPRTKLYNFEYYPSRPGLWPKLVTYYHLLRINMLKKHRPISNTEAKKAAIEGKRLVIQVMYGGLGDHLLYSSLPRMLREKYGTETFISNKSLYRSPEIRKIVWEANPFVKFTDEKGWQFSGQGSDGSGTHDRLIQSVFGLETTGTPEIYYKPKKMPELEGRTIIDVSFGPSGKTAYKYHTQEFLEKLVRYLREHVSSFVLITHSQDGYSSNNAEELIKKTFNPTSYEVSTLDELADVFASSKERYLLFSGGASVSAALKIPSTILCNEYIDHRFAYTSINKYIDLSK